MRILRYLIATFFLLLTIAGGFITYTLFRFDPRQAYINIAGFEVHAGYLAAGATVILLLLAIVFLPTKGRRKAEKKPKTMPGLSREEARALVKTKKEAKKEDTLKMPTEPEGSAAEGQAAQPEPKEEYVDHFEMPEGAGVREDENIDSYSRLKDPQAMARLVSIEQGDIDRGVLKGLLYEYYPDLITLTDRISDDDETTTDTIARHIISIARSKLKLTEEGMSDNQFSIFQNKVFDEEQKEFVQIYKPGDPSKLSVEQKAFVGKVVDRLAWQKVQRRILAGREDWKPVTLVNAKELLGG